MPVVSSPECPDNESSTSGWSENTPEDSEVSLDDSVGTNPTEDSRHHKRP